jgi:hypothetical protein
LRLEVRHFRIHDRKLGKLELLMDFRKTAQDGGRIPVSIEYAQQLIRFNRDQTILSLLQP